MAVILEVENAAFSYSRGKPVFRDISFTVDQGEILSILGRNGTGKSTLIKCLLNLMPLGQGRIRLSGMNIAHLSPSEIAGIAAYVPQTSQAVFPFSVFEFVLMGRAPHLSPFKTPGAADMRMTVKSLEETGISHLARDSIADISGGEKQLVLIARAINQCPRLLVLDEPVSHLDMGNQMKVLSLVKRLSRHGMSIIMTSHFPDHSFLFPQRVALMQKGRLRGPGTAASVLSPENLSEAYGVPVDVCYHPQAGRPVCLPKTP